MFIPVKADTGSEVRHERNQVGSFLYQ